RRSMVAPVMPGSALGSPRASHRLTQSILSAASEAKLRTMHTLFEPLESEAHAGVRLAPVVMAVALDQTYGYLVPQGVESEPGCVGRVRFGPQSRIGVVWDKPVGEPGKAVDAKKLKAITARLEVPPLPALSLRFAEWIAKYTLAPLGMTVRMMMSARAV